MQRTTNQALIIFAIAASAYLLYLLAPMLTPFLLGALLAYLANPLVKHLDKWGVPHLLSVVSVFILIFSAFLLLILMLIPLIQAQISALIDVIPQIIAWVQVTVMPFFAKYINTDTIMATLSANIPKPTWVFSTVLKSGYTIIDWMVNIVLTPIIMFYLLRDWNKILKAATGLLPKSIKPTIVTLVKESDEVLGAFFRGQLLVMLSLSLIYGIGLTLVGLHVGLIIGVIGGLLSIVPYLGSIFVVVMASITTLVQFGTWQPLVWVLVVYLFGQMIESYVLTPYLVGNRIGLHPVAVIFAIMAGGTLFGFFGILVALPVAAVIMVMLRYVRRQYQAA